MRNKKGKYVIIKTYSYNISGLIYTHNVKVNLNAKLFKIYNVYFSIIRKILKT